MVFRSQPSRCPTDIKHFVAIRHQMFAFKPNSVARLIISAALATLSFCMIRRRWNSTVLALMPSLEAMSAAESPIAVRLTTCFSRSDRRSGWRFNGIEQPEEGWTIVALAVTKTLNGHKQFRSVVALHHHRLGVHIGYLAYRPGFFVHGIYHHLCGWLYVANVLYEHGSAFAVEVEIGYKYVYFMSVEHLFCLFKPCGIHDTGFGKRRSH